MSYYDNIDTPHMPLYFKYYPFDYLLPDNREIRKRIFYKRIDNIYRKTGKKEFYFILRDNMMINYLIAEGKKNYNIGSGVSSFILRNPSDQTNQPNQSTRYFLSYQMFYDLEHPKPVIIKILVI